MRSIKVPPRIDLPIRVTSGGKLKALEGDVVISNGSEAIIVYEGRELDLKEFGVIPEKICVKNPNDFEVKVGLIL